MRSQTNPLQQVCERREYMPFVYEKVIKFSFYRYLKLKVPEAGGMIIESSDSRKRVFEQLMEPPKTKEEVVHLLSHQTEDNFTIFRDNKPGDKSREPIATIAVGKMMD